MFFEVFQERIHRKVQNTEIVESPSTHPSIVCDSEKLSLAFAFYFKQQIRSGQRDVMFQRSIFPDISAKTKTLVFRFCKRILEPIAMTTFTKIYYRSLTTTDRYVAFDEGYHVLILWVVFGVLCMHGRRIWRPVLVKFAIIKLPHSSVFFSHFCTFYQLVVYCHRRYNFF